jgi:hypothetical protein
MPETVVLTAQIKIAPAAARMIESESPMSSFSLGGLYRRE